MADMSSIGRKASRIYPRKAEIERAIAAARSAGIDVSGVDVFPNGMIRIVESRGAPAAINDFDRYESEL